MVSIFIIFIYNKWSLSLSLHLLDGVLLHFTDKFETLEIEAKVKCIDIDTGYTTHYTFKCDDDDRREKT